MTARERIRPDQETIRTWRCRGSFKPGRVVHWVMPHASHKACLWSRSRVTLFWPPNLSRTGWNQDVVTESCGPTLREKWSYPSLVIPCPERPSHQHHSGFPLFLASFFNPNFWPSGNRLKSSYIQLEAYFWQCRYGSSCGGNGGD